MLQNKFFAVCYIQKSTSVKVDPAHDMPETIFFYGIFTQKTGGNG